MPQMTDTIEAKTRTPSKKSGTHKARKAGLVPATAYGPAHQPVYLSLDPKTFGLQRQQFGTSHLFDLKVDDQTPFKALIREIQQSPVTQEILHVDFYALDMTKPIKVEVPLELEGKPAGLMDGGILSQIMRKIEIEVLPTAIPDKLVVDVSALTIGQSIKASEVKAIPGVKILTKADQAVAAFMAPAEEEVAPTAAVEGVEGAVAAEGAVPGAEGAAPAEGAAAAPAASAAAAKPGEKAPAGKGEGKAGKEGKK